MDSRPNLYGMDRGALAAFLESYGAPPFHAAQIYRWLHARHRFEPVQWTDLSKELRRRISRDAVVDPGRIGARTEAVDGTVKYRIDLAPGDAVETVYMEQAERVTLCVSSQVGCALGCVFCLTGQMGLSRHLTAAEIAGQVALVILDRALRETAFNIVFMGMGEPLHNYDGVLGAYRLLVDPDGFGISRRRIMISTSGLVPEIERLSREPQRPRLAVSLNATTDDLRSRIMPINRKYPLRRLIDACRSYADATREPLTFEYVLLAEVNDTDGDVARLAGLCRSASAKLNLIPFNRVPDRLPYRAPTREKVLDIRDRLLGQGVRASIRWSRGAEARAACGQLALLPEDRPAPPADGGDRP
jgi:23S rRNA (adenine2503-C2)-methyltransferase